MSDYYETHVLRSILDANGVFWTDMPMDGRMRTLFEVGGCKWYANEMAGGFAMTVATVSDAGHLARSLGLEVGE